MCRDCLFRSRMGSQRYGASRSWGHLTGDKHHSPAALWDNSFDQPGHALALRSVQLRRAGGDGQFLRDVEAGSAIIDKVERLRVAEGTCAEPPRATPRHIERFAETMRKRSDSRQAPVEILARRGQLHASDAEISARQSKICSRSARDEFELVTSVAAAGAFAC